jgi:sirohydrochlorin cobaltochelatase
MTSGSVRHDTAVLLVAHGSDRSPAVAALVRRQAEQLAAWGIGDEVTAAYLRAEPRVEQVLDQLEATRVVVVPLLTSEGYYTQDVLPQALRANRRFEGVRLHVTPPIGRHRGLESLVARRVRRFLVSGAPDATLLVVGHGTVRHPNSRAATERFAAGVARRVGRPARTAFLDDTPRLEEVWPETPARPVIVVPFLLGGGAHASQDIMERLGVEAGVAAQWVQAAGRPVLVDWPVGTLDGVVDLVAEWAVKGLARLADRDAGARSRRGRVFLVGAGPGDPGLLTVRGRALLRRADVVVHDRLIDPRVLGQARSEA